MARKSPVASAQFDIELRDKSDAISQLAARGEEDWRALQPLREKLAKFYRQAYLLNNEPVNAPWVGACNIQLPIEDKYKARMRGPLRALLGHGSTQFCQVRPGPGDSSVLRAANLEMRLNSVLRGDFRVFSQQDWSTVSNFLVESLLQHGFGFLSPGYRYETEVGSKEIRQRDLPGVLQFMSFVPEVRTEVERARYVAAMEQQGIDPNPPVLLSMFGGEAVNPVTTEVFDRHKDVFKRLVSEGFDLDYDDPLEQQACDEIMSWMRAGAKATLVVLTRMVVCDHPELRYVEPHRLICPGRADTAPSIAMADRVTEIMPMTEGRLRSFGHDMGWSRSAVEKAAGSIGAGAAFGQQDDELKFEMVERSGEVNIITSDSVESEVVEVVRSLRRVKHRGAYVRVETYYEPRSGTLLSHRLLPFNMPGWNYVRASFEENEPGVYSPRGLPETIHEQSRYVTATHRAAQNSRVIATSRGFFFDERLGIDENDPFWGPGVIRNVNLKGARVGLSEAMREIAPAPGAAQDWSQEEFFHQSMIDDHLGDSGAFVRDARLLEPITATEQMSRDRKTAQVSSPRGGILVDSFAQALSMMAAYDQQFIGDRAPVWANGTVTWLTPDDIRGSVVVRPMASVGDMSPEFRQERAFRRLSVLAQMGQSVPDIATDPNYKISYMAALEDWLREDDPEAAARLLKPRSPEEQQQLAQQLQQQAQAAEQAQGLAVEGEQLKNEEVRAKIEKLRAEAMSEMMK